MTMGDELNESQSQEAESHAQEDGQHEDEGSMLEAIEQGLGLDQEQAEDQGGEANDEEAPDGTEDAALKKAGDEPASPKDDEDLSMPDGLSIKAQDRFRKLTGRLQETSQALKGATEELDLPLIHTSEPTILLSISYAVFCSKKKKVHDLSQSHSARWCIR